MNQEVAFKTVVSGLMEENVAPSMMERALDSVKSAGTKKLRMIDAIFREKVHADLDFSGDHDTIESEDDGEEEEEEEDREMGENWKKQGGIEQVAPKSIMAKDTASLPRPSRSVQFSLNNDLYCSEQLKSLSHAELQARVRNLQVQMTDAIISLSSERAARRKNEKNLLKLAKELQKRANEISSKNDQVIKVRIHLSWGLCLRLPGQLSIPIQQRATFTNMPPLFPASLPKLSIRLKLELERRPMSTKWK